MTTATHPFDHFGPAPYRFVGLRTIDEVNAALEKQGYDPLVKRGDSGIGTCIGTCEHCGTPISIAVHFEASNGSRFHVGETCAKKAFQPGSKALSEAVAACNQRRTELRKQKVLTQFNRAVEWLEFALVDGPHPKGFQGETLKDYLYWYKENAGKAKFVEVCKQHGFQ